MPCYYTIAKTVKRLSFEGGDSKGKVKLTAISFFYKTNHNTELSFAFAVTPQDKALNSFSNDIIVRFCVLDWKKVDS